MNFKQVFGSGSVGKKLTAIGGIAVLGAAIVGVVGNHSVDDVGTALKTQTVTAKALRNFMESDMMHDAMRADVFNALLSETADAKTTVKSDVTDHAKNFEDALAANKALPLIVM